MRYNVVVDRRAMIDIRKAAVYYDDKSAGLGTRFKNTLSEYFDMLAKSPAFQIRYKNVRCIPMKEFPFMVHFSIDKKTNTVLVHAVFHTSINPDKWKIR